MARLIIKTTQIIIALMIPTKMNVNFVVLYYHHSHQTQVIQQHLQPQEQFENLRCDLCAALTAPATVTIIAIGNENKLEYKSGPNGAHTQSHLTVPRGDTPFNFVAIRAGTRGFNFSNDVFDEVLNEYELEYEINNIFGYYFNEHFVDNDIVVSSGGILAAGGTSFNGDTSTEKTNKRKVAAKQDV